LVSRLCPRQVKQESFFSLDSLTVRDGGGALPKAPCLIVVRVWPCCPSQTRTSATVGNFHFGVPGALGLRHVRGLSRQKASDMRGVKGGKAGLLYAPSSSLNKNPPQDSFASHHHIPTKPPDSEYPEKWRLKTNTETVQFRIENSAEAEIYASVSNLRKRRYSVDEYSSVSTTHLERTSWE
jgi:hypothetical protein